jgi:exopolyphosphatase/guanosine-5'-triphosphate,3'-diphosphate pyrophosphatase
MQNQERVAIIDLGSNTARLVVMSAVPGYAYKLDDEIREVVRLRQGLTADGLSEEAQSRALFTLRLFKRYCDSSHVDLIIPTATSAVREGSNGVLFVERVRQEIGLSLRVLSGEEEAYYGTLGVLNEVPLTDAYILDIGGGSAQLSQVVDRRFRRGVSLLLGALALTEEYIRKDPPSGKEIGAVEQGVRDQLSTIEWLPAGKKANGAARLVGLGGTIRNMAKMAAARQVYPLNTLHGFVLGRRDLDENIRLLAELPLSEREELPGLSSDRADIILPGALVLREVMDGLRVDDLTISVNGLREGLFFEHFWRHLSYPALTNMRQFSVLNKARTYQYAKTHANHVRFLAGRLFNQLAPLHGYTLAERELLDAAAMLHDLGTLISYNDHHHHSQSLIINSGLPSFTPRETALIALLTRYHRKGKPRTDEYESVVDDGDERLLLHLAAMLRLAEFLERGRNQSVDDVSAGWNDDTLRLTLLADEYPAVEIWEAERNAVELMERAFDRQVVIESAAAPGDWSAQDVVPVA